MSAAIGFSTQRYSQKREGGPRKRILGRRPEVRGRFADEENPNCLSERLDGSQSDVALDDTFRDRVASQTGDIMDPELIHNLLPMLFDGFNADA
jgi:hypothetical protein